eukprot:3814628-Rhodomonas_salina.1
MELCEHGKTSVEYCRLCLNPEKKTGYKGNCIHGVTRISCTDCKGLQSICSHGKRRGRCPECTPNFFCEVHKLVPKTTCKICLVCEHNTQKKTCKECSPQNYCEHGVLIKGMKCKECKKEEVQVPVQLTPKKRMLDEVDNAIDRVGAIDQVEEIEQVEAIEQ